MAIVIRIEVIDDQRHKVVAPCRAIDVKAPREVIDKAVSDALAKAAPAVAGAEWERPIPGRMA
jgi:hypothetical protein